MRTALAFVLVSACAGSGPSAEHTGAHVDEPCPGVAALPQGATGTGPSLVGEGYPSDLEGMLASLPAHVDGWTRTVAGTTARGTAGVATPNATETLAKDGAEVRIDVFDLVHQCRCERGMGRMLRDRSVAHGTGQREPRTFGSSPAVLAREGTISSVEAWVGDRCLVRIEGATPAANVEAIAAALDWNQLERVCGRREP